MPLKKRKAPRPATQKKARKKVPGKRVVAPKRAPRATRKPGRRAGPQIARGTGKKPVRASAKSREWQLRLYVAGQTPKSIAAFANLKRICDEHLAGRYRIEIVDLMENPTLARGDQIVAIPTLVRRLPHPVRKIIGDLSNTERVLVGLQLLPG